MQAQYQPAPTTVVVQAAPSRPTSYLGLAIFVCLCINAVLGLVAIIFSVMSSSAADDQDMEKAKSRGKVSMILSLVGIAITILSIIIICIYVFVILPKQTRDYTNDLLAELNKYSNN